MFTLPEWWNLSDAYTGLVKQVVKEDTTKDQVRNPTEQLNINHKLIGLSFRFTIWIVIKKVKESSLFTWLKKKNCSETKKNTIIFFEKNQQWSLSFILFAVRRPAHFFYRIYRCFQLRLICNIYKFIHWRLAKKIFIRLRSCWPNIQKETWLSIDLLLFSIF